MCIRDRAGSDTYSGGSSTRVSVCNKDGSEVDYSTFKEISKWKHILQGGNFNGMEDIYEYREDSLTTDKGMDLKYFPSYIFIDNKPQWGTVEYWVCPIKPGKILYEMEGVDEELAKEAFALASAKMPIATTFIRRV